MVLITDKFWGPSGAETVIGNVHIWLAEAINALQDNKDTLTTKVCEGRGLGAGTVSIGGSVPNMALPGPEKACCLSRTPLVSL